MSIVTKITDYVSRVKEFFLAQYRDKPKFEGWQEAFDEQVQDLEDALQDAFDKRTVDNGFGVILDEIGEIVQQDRGGFADDFYKNLLKAKIGENTSQGDIEKIIEIATILTDSTLVHLQEHFPHGISLSVNGVLDPTLINFFYERLNRVDMGGVRMEFLSCFDPVEPFALEGEPGPGLGLGDVNDAGVGGQLAEIKVKTQPAFSFEAEAGVTDGDFGLGTIEDPLVGGHLVGI